MKTKFLLTALSAMAFTAASHAGEPSKAVVPPAPAPSPIIYGTGPYFGLQAGINAYQNFGGTRHFNVNGNDLAIEPREKVGFAGGLKAGYVFGTGTVRPAIEADLYYNGVRADLDARINKHSTNLNADGTLHSGAFMGNFLVRFAFDRFQPYVGGGVGAWVGQAHDVDVTIRGHDYNLGNSSSRAGFAWQIIGGADYYWSEKFSTFLEYKFLNYEDAGISRDRIGQQIVMLGVRWHF